MLEEISSRRFQESLDSRNGDAMKKLNEKNRFVVVFGSGCWLVVVGCWLVVSG